MKILSATPTLDTNAYSAGDAAGGMLTFDFGRTGFNTVLLKRAELLDDAAAPDSADMSLHLFTDPTLAVADQAAFSVTQDEYNDGMYLGAIDFTSYAATPAGTNAAAVVAIRDAIDRLLPVTNGKIYGQLVCNGTPTFAATQLHVLLHFAEYA